MHFVAVVEGALLLAKTDSNSLSVAAQLEHFRVYVHYLLGAPVPPGKEISQ
jgi:hypothetical protein